MKHRTSNIQHRTSDYLAGLVILLLALVRPAGRRLRPAPAGALARYPVTMSGKLFKTSE
jgi:hypothetical protein